MASLAAALKNGIPEHFEARSEEQKARWLLADSLDWHWREARVAFWEKYRLEEMTDEQLMDEREAIAELKWERQIAPEGRRKIRVSAYTFPPQEMNLEEGDPLYSRGEPLGSVAFIDVAQRLVHVRQREDARDARPRSVYSHQVVRTEQQADSLDAFCGRRCGTRIRRQPNL